MSFEIRKAERSAQKLRIVLDGPSGSGKTYSLLRLAFTMRASGLCQKIVVIDTENGSSECYAGESPDGKPWDFDVLQLDSFAPTTYVQAMVHAHRQGYDCIIIDSLSHEWMGKDGALDMVDKKGGQFGAWKDVTPLHRQLVDAILRCPGHVLASMRTKSEYVIEDAVNKSGRTTKTPRKLGTTAIQREGIEFEFTLYGSMDLDHILKISKSRCPAMQDQTYPKPDASFWQPLIDWLKSAPEKPIKTPAESAKSILDVAGLPVQFGSDIKPPQPPAALPAPVYVSPEELVQIEMYLDSEWCGLEAFMSAQKIDTAAKIPAKWAAQLLRKCKAITEIEAIAMDKCMVLEDVLETAGKPALLKLSDQELSALRESLLAAPAKQIPL